MAAAIVNSSIPSSEEFLCDPLPSWGIGVGVAMGVAGSIGINIGQNVQAMGIKTLDPSDYTSPWKSKLWRIGLCIFITFALINFAALSLAPASILCPIESIQFVTNVVWNAVVNKIRINGKMKFGVVCAIIGTVLTVTFGAPGGCHSPAMLVTYWQSLTWWIYLMITLSVAAAAFTVHRRYRKLDQEGTPPPHPALLPVCYSLYCALVGGAQLIVHSKMISVLLSVITEDPAAVFTSWLFYVELLLVCVCGITWGIKLTECLALYDPLIIIPLMVGFYISFGGVAGGIFFQEFEKLHEAWPSIGYGGWALYLGGMAMVIGGLAIIATASIDHAGRVVPIDASRELEDFDVPESPKCAGEAEVWTLSADETADELGKRHTPPPVRLSRANTERLSVSKRTLETGPLELPSLDTAARARTDTLDSGASESSERRVRQDSRERADTTHSTNQSASRRRSRISREQMLHELLYTPAPSMLPSPFGVMMMAPMPPGGSGSRPSSSALRRAQTWTNFGAQAAAAAAAAVPSTEVSPCSSIAIGSSVGSSHASSLPGSKPGSAQKRSGGSDAQKRSGTSDRALPERSSKGRPSSGSAQMATVCEKPEYVSSLSNVREAHSSDEIGSSDGERRADADEAALPDVAPAEFNSVLDLSPTGGDGGRRPSVEVEDLP